MRRSDILGRFVRVGAAGLLAAGFAVQVAQAGLPTGGMMLPKPKGPARADIPTKTSISTTRVPSAVAYGIAGGGTAARLGAVANAAPAAVPSRSGAMPKITARTAAIDPSNPFAVPAPGEATEQPGPRPLAEDATAPDEWAAEGATSGKGETEPVSTEAAPAAPGDGEFAGLKGICPVTLREERRAVKPKPELFSEFAGRRYEFATPEAKAAFDADPEHYAPVLGGRDVVMTANGVEEAVGTLKHAGFYRERLYLFQTEESYKKFYENPRRFVVE